MVGVIRRAGSLGGVAGDFLGSGGHLVHRRGHLVGALELVVGAERHVASNAAQLAAGAFQLLSVVLQPADGVGEEVAQGVGRTRQAPQFVLAAAVHLGGKAALA
ncbi:hypothetical protein D9M71_785110 [compost metagenome]